MVARKTGKSSYVFYKYAVLCRLYAAFMRIFMHFGGRGKILWLVLGLKKLGATDENGARHSILSRPSP